MQNTVQQTCKSKTESIHLVEPKSTTSHTSPPFPDINVRTPHTDKIQTTLSDNSRLNHQAPITDSIDTSSNKECLLERNGYSIHLVDSLKQRIKTSTFLQFMYASHGYHTESATTFTNNPNQITFEATSKQILLGTLTLAIDSDQGLLADDLYKQEIDNLRTKNRRICEISKLAFNKNTGSKRIFAELFHLAYIYAHHKHKATNAVIEVHPRHASFYKRMLGFNQIGKQRICPRVDAPAVLLHLGRRHVNHQLTSFRLRSDNSNNKSIYSHFLSPHEEKKLKQKILENKPDYKI